MKNTAKLKYFGLLIPLLLTACGPTTTTSLKSPAEDGGLEAGQENDSVVKTDSSTLKTFLEKVAKNEFYSYDLTMTIYGDSIHFKNYYSPNAFYEHNDVFENSIGYAQNKNGEVFNFRLSEDFSTIYPSLFVYYNYNDLTKVNDLYDALLTIPNFTFLSYSMDDYSAEHIAGNKFLITDPNISSIFQYMTSYGTSIQEFVTGLYVEILDDENLSFRSTIELGSAGTIVGIYQKGDCVPVLEANNKIIKGELDGIEYHEDIGNFFDLANQDNYTINGIFEKMTTGQQTSYPQNYYCTKDYFYIEYLEPYSQNYHNWGYALIPANTEITYYDFVDGVKGQAHTQTLEYDACYRFRKYNNEFIFDFFKGPVEDSNTKFLKVDKLPETGRTGIFYIVYDSEKGKNEVYVWGSDSNGIPVFQNYGEWFDTVGDFFITDSATFYLGSSSVGLAGKYYFEQSIDDENKYFTRNKDILAGLAQGLFGWGWNPTNTWMDYILGSTITLRKDSKQNITEADIAMQIELSTEVKEMYYTLKDFGSTKVTDVEEFLKGVKR